MLPSSASMLTIALLKEIDPARFALRDPKRTDRGAQTPIFGATGMSECVTAGTHNA
jgi:hypothetical protein